MAETKPGWWFNEFQHLGVDFDDADVVETYMDQQGTRAADEQALIDRLGISTQDRVLEFGCGTGLFAIEAAKRCHHVYAVDISHAMLKSVQRSAESAGMTNLTLIHGGFLSYEHQSDPVDYVVSKYAFHHLPDFWKSVALDHIAKVLKSQGTLYLEDVIYSFPPDEYEQYLDGWIKQVANPNSTSFSVTEFEMHVREEYSTFDWIIEGLLERNGFEIREKHIKSATYANYITVKR